MKKEVGQLIAQRDNYLNLASQEVDQTVKDRYLKAARQLEEAIVREISEYTPYIPKETEALEKMLSLLLPQKLTVINGRPGKDGKDAVVDYDKIVRMVTEKIKERPEKVVKIEKSLSEEEIEEIKESIKKDISYNDLKDIPLYRPAARDYDFLELKDVPKSYTGKAGKVLKVRTDERGVEFADAASGTGDISGTGVANELAYFTAEKTIDNLPVATYPSLTELSYVKGVTSAIQTQLNGKQASGSYEVTTNKETSALDTSTTKYPCNNVVKEAVDAKAPSASPTFTGTVETPAIKITTGAGLGKVLTSDADGDATWETPAATVTKATGAELDTGTDDAKFATAKALADSNYEKNPMTTAGDIIYGGASGAPTRLAKGTAGQVLTMNSGATAPEWAAASAGSSVWTAVPGTPTRTGNTTFTITGDYTALVTTGMVIKWTQSSVVKAGLVLSSTYSSPNTTVTIVGDTMASIDASSCKYFNKAADVIHFAYAGTIGATATDVMRAWYADKAYRVLGAKPSVGTAGTTNNTTFDININGTTAFTTKPTIATTAATGTIFTADNGKSLAINDKVTIDVDAVQTTPAVDGYIDLFVLPTFYLSLT